MPSRRCSVTTLTSKPARPQLARNAPLTNHARPAQVDTQWPDSRPAATLQAASGPAGSQSLLAHLIGPIPGRPGSRVGVKTRVNDKRPLDDLAVLEGRVGEPVRVSATARLSR